MSLIPTYFRSSSVGQFKMCEHKFWMVYMMGQDDPSNKAANIGNAVHKALELGARCKFAKQNNEEFFEEKETKTLWEVSKFTYDEAIEEGYKLYSDKSDWCNWKPQDLTECRRLLNKAIEDHDGVFNPLNRTIVAPEEYFDIELPYSWAKREDGSQIHMMGTLDLVLEIDWETIELVDWKTGRRHDWAINREKDYQALNFDHQLVMYHYALCHKYPDKKKFVTINWIKDGGAYTLPYGMAQLHYNEEMLKKVYDRIISTKFPKLANNHSCKFCNFDKTIDEKTGKTLCKKFKDEIVELGLKNTVNKYATKGDYTYTGGGRMDVKI